MKQHPLTQQHRDILRHFGLDGERACLQQYSQGEYLMQQGYAISHFLILLSGDVDVKNYDSAGRQILFGAQMTDELPELQQQLAEDEPGPLGDQELVLGRSTALNTVTARSTVKCIALPWENARAQLQQSVRFSNLMAHAVVVKLTALQNNYRTVALKSGEARFCGYLLQNAQGSVFRDTLTDTAPVVGLSYRQLQRIARTLCEQGVLQKQQRGYLICDRAALQRLAAQ